MWFFGLVVVVLIGAVAVVASGRWGGMSTAYDDRPDVSVPARQALSSDDIATTRFAVTLRGYRMDEVDGLLERLGREVAERDRRIADLERAVTPILHGPEGAGFASRADYDPADFDDTGYQKPILVGGDFPPTKPTIEAAPEPTTQDTAADSLPPQPEATSQETAADSPPQPEAALLEAAADSLSSQPEPGLPPEPVLPPQEPGLPPEPEPAPLPEPEPVLPPEPTLPPPADTASTQQANPYDAPAQATPGQAIPYADPADTPIPTPADPHEAPAPQADPYAVSAGEVEPWFEDGVSVVGEHSAGETESPESDADAGFSEAATNQAGPAAAGFPDSGTAQGEPVGGNGKSGARGRHSAAPDVVRRTGR